MTASRKKVKMILFLAIVLIAVLLFSSTTLLINIHKKCKEIAIQQQQISQLESKLNFYKNQEATGQSKDDKENDSDVVVQGE